MEADGGVGAEPGLVLFVDGDTSFRETLADGASDELDRFTHVVAESATAGLERLENNDVDCVVSGYDLPERDGLDFLQTVRKTHPDLPFILFPADGSEAIASRAVSLGVSEYLPRDGTTERYEELAGRIDAAIRRQRGELESARVNDQFEKLIRNSSDVVFIVDAEGTYQYVSPAVEDILGYEPAEMVGENGFEYVHPDDVDETMEEFFRAIDDPGHTSNVEFRAQHVDGSWRWLEVRGQNLLEDPDIGGFVVNARDVTERKEYERQVAEQEQRLWRIANHLPETVIWMTDPTFSEVFYVSPGYEDIWGRPVEQLYEDPGTFIEGVHPDDRERVLAGMDALEPGPEPDESAVADRIEYRVVRPDDTVSWVRGTTVGIRDEDGEVTRWIGLATDITGRKEHERELEGYETLHRTVPDGLFLLDEEGVMHHVNHAWARMLDKQPAELEGESYRTLLEEGIIEEPATQRFRDLLRDLLSSENDRDRGTLTIRTTLPSQSREHVYEAHVGLLPYEDSYRGSAVVVRALTAFERRYEA